MADLLEGRGAGYALAAELNHYPGPKHVLELAPALALSPAQEAAVRETAAPMEQQAKALGQQFVDLEADLDRAFRSGTLTPDDLEQRTAAIAAIEGRLRAVHLAAHLQVKTILTPEQVARYDNLRGYTTPNGAAGDAVHRHDSTSAH